MYQIFHFKNEFFVAIKSSSFQIVICMTVVEESLRIFNTLEFSLESFKISSLLLRKLFKHPNRNCHSLKLQKSLLIARSSNQNHRKNYNSSREFLIKTMHITLTNTLFHRSYYFSATRGQRQHFFVLNTRTVSSSS